MTVRTRSEGEAILDAFKVIFPRRLGASLEDAHKVLDQHFQDPNDPGRSAPGWAHKLLDFLWDLLV